jgi:peptidoglycan/LPS O-acetylase OafA/YrhL/lysophospholipase L1-like esterase
MSNNQQNNFRFEWVDALKALAILGILLNHFVEEFGAGPWFSNPSYNWPDLTYRLSHIFPDGQNLVTIGVKFLGWLGDMGPGVFILLSGFTLALSQFKKEKTIGEFYSSRLARIFPLYIAIHIIVLAFALIVQQPANINLFSPRVLLSIMGLRFTDTLFFYINPSWWFIWLILQMYLLFPLLFRLLKNSNNITFISVTLGITILSRLAGLLNLTYSNNLYYWMTGLFAGTRLVEFTAGMFLAKIIISRKTNIKALSIKTSTVALSGFGIYLSGFILSWFYVGSLFSNALITIGLSGVFYGVFQFLRNMIQVKKALNFIGKNSFSVFLIHQPFMVYFGDHLNGISKFIVLCIIIIIAFPIGFLLEKLVNFTLKWIMNNLKKYASLIAGKFAWYFLAAYTSLIILLHAASLVISRNISTYINLLTATYFLLLIVFTIASYVHYKKIKQPLVILFSIICIVFYVIFPTDWIPLISITLVFATLFYILCKPLKNIFIRISLSLLLTAIAFISTESFFRIKKPLETRIWSEFPALQKDNKTIYSLIPDKETHLIYNNYNYTLRTNSMGFACPEINLSVQDSSTYRIYIVGDAFAMPEGMEYEYSFPGILESILKKKVKNKNIQVINGGVTGYGPNEMLAQINNYIDTIKPDLIINEFFVNEFQEINYTPEQRLTNIGFTINESRRTKLWGYSQNIKYFEKLLRKIARKPDVHYNYNKSLLNIYQKDSPYYADSVIRKIDNYLGQVKSICDSMQVEYWLLYVPGQIEVSSAEHIDFYPSHKNLNDTSIFDFNISHQIINSISKKHNIILLDTKDILKNHKEQPVYFPASWHWNKAGHKLIANELAEKIQTQLN